MKVEGWVTGGSIFTSKKGWAVRESISIKVEDLRNHNPGKELQ